MPELTPNIIDQVAAASQEDAAEAVPKAVEPGPVSAVQPTTEPKTAAMQPRAAGSPEKPTKCRTSDAKRLPPYTRSLLRIKVPVVVTLAQNRQPLHRILELGSGSIIQFDKSCEEMLELSVGDHTVAHGEAVKVGDKFGLRITSMILPEERFLPLREK